MKCCPEIVKSHLGKTFTATATCCSLPRRCPVCFEPYQLPHLTTCGREKAFSLCRSLCHFPMLKSLCVTWFSQRVHYLQRKQGRKTGIGWSWPVSPDVRFKRRMLAAPSVKPSSKAIDFASKGSLGYSPRALGLAKRHQDVRNVSISFAAFRSGVQMGRSLPL